MPEPGTARVTPDGLLRMEGLLMRCALGHGGIKVDKEEGDGATPTGILPLRRVLYRADRGVPPRSVVPVEPLAPEDGWCDDPRDPAYNTRVKLPYEASHEELWRRDAIYDLIGILGWNDAPVVRGRGSAIFLHVARPDYAPTEGCIALSEPDVRALLAAGLRAIEVIG
ncbi:L,D-peptidoglycan transpeptidase YkuD (ErfK/YbiS/YcfS/YnhG family) [Humitalea rosea]|uniref:L,D-peptidoglycan transpeptidase YkuD (ErfK/YbiS/YcfS/YnhG family) n=1 Tax=Humitalea rosea TaxID=990373 RepID=A0A2W7INT4_9PROT|nr:L,D-transpeptidase family protein [Humitalea rosea]PZW41047.1 L,D-peptidoglycan transpeptidase YkuD (ErfK/YbiS/YcfS/YnhG family) [Humitalea rosea]